MIDFERVEEESSAWVLGHVRADKKQVIREIEAFSRGAGPIAFQSACS